LEFRGIVGRAEIWLDGKRVADKPGYDEAALELPLPPGNAERVVTLLVENEPGRPGGLSKPVLVSDN
jgi:beta-galactosidase